MSTTAQAARRTTLATRVVFLVAGIAMAAWAPLVPLAKARTGLDDATLGLVLLCFGGGSLVAMPAAGLSAARFGIRAVILAAVATIVVVLPLLASVGDPLVLAATLFAFGAGLGTLDVSMNLQAVAVERAGGRAMMSGFHAMFSVGGIVGSAGVAIALTAGVDVVVAVVAAIAAMALAVGAVAPGLMSEVSRTTRPSFRFPHGVVLLIGSLAAAAFLIEGAVLDWSALFMTSVRDMPVARASAGYVAFSIAMTVGRFTGDAVVRRLGGRRVLFAGALCSATGMAIVALVPSWIAGVAGFALVGAGNANIVPVLFTAAGRQTLMPESLAVPALTTLGYAGLLAGPAAIGFVANATGLPVAFGLLALLMVIVAVTSRRLAT